MSNKHYSREGYEAYCKMILSDFPTITPSTYEEWVRYNEAIDANPY